MYKNPPRSRKVQAPGATKIVGKKEEEKKILDFFSQFFFSKLLIHSFIMRDLSKSLTVAHLS